MIRLLLAALAAWTLALAPAAPARAQAALPAAPDKMIEALSNQILDRIRADKDLRDGDLRRLSQFVDETVMPYVNFERMTALAVGRAWRTATPEQQKQLMTEFRSLLLRTYAGALSSVKDQTVRVKPLRAAPEDTEVVVRTEIVQSRGDPIQLDYRMEKHNPHWKIYDLNVLGVWLIETYRNQFAQEINARGVDGLVKALGDRNRQFAAQGGKS
ncbi:MAG TPA: ABC transporter substrate-binding protein [Burkholderiaceae bacterium]|nr:ABC transporter substrate-binding protein [Burkholderiaceae bacterium]